MGISNQSDGNLATTVLKYDQVAFLNIEAFDLKLLRRHLESHCNYLKLTKLKPGNVNVGKNPKIQDKSVLARNVLPRGKNYCGLFKNSWITDTEVLKKK